MCVTKADNSRDESVTDYPQDLELLEISTQYSKLFWIYEDSSTWKWNGHCSQQFIHYNKTVFASFLDLCLSHDDQKWQEHQQIFLSDPILTTQKQTLSEFGHFNGENYI